MILGHEPNADLGPLISPQAKQRVLDLVNSGVKEGAELLLDGRDVSVPGYEKGNFVGPTILHKVQPDMTCYKEVKWSRHCIHYYSHKSHMDIIMI